MTGTAVLNQAALVPLSASMTPYILPRPLFLQIILPRVPGALCEHTKASHSQAKPRA